MLNDEQIADLFQDLVKDLTKKRAEGHDNLCVFMDEIMASEFRNTVTRWNQHDWRMVNNNNGWREQVIGYDVITCKMPQNYPKWIVAVKD